MRLLSGALLKNSKRVSDRNMIQTQVTCSYIRIFVRVVYSFFNRKLPWMGRFRHPLGILGTLTARMATASVVAASVGEGLISFVCLSVFRMHWRCHIMRNIAQNGLVGSRTGPHQVFLAQWWPHKGRHLFIFHSWKLGHLMPMFIVGLINWIKHTVRAISRVEVFESWIK